ncbi:MAG TPA: hypothetical protein DCZ03_13160 [Gammaproteobacteria bacterium]|nr:hypothetical protein [Gammaproteobacteria bacterium]
MTSLEILEALISHYGSQAEVAEKIGRSRKTPLKKKGQIASKSIEADLLDLWQSFEQEKKSVEDNRTSTNIENKQLPSSKPNPVEVVDNTNGYKVLYQRPHCPYAALVRMALERKAIDFVSVRVDEGSLIDQKLAAQGSLSLPLFWDEQMWIHHTRPILTHLDQNYTDNSVPSIKERLLNRLLFNLMD